MGTMAAYTRAAPPDGAASWLRDMQTSHAALTTTGGLLWNASLRLIGEGLDGLQRGLEGAGQAGADVSGGGRRGMHAACTLLASEALQG